MEILTENSSQTKKSGKILAQEILKEPLKKEAMVLGLEGELGSGKTAFLQGFAKGLGVKEKVFSPTFVIMRKFKIFPKNKKKTNAPLFFYHLDCYRVDNKKDILSLGFKKIISDPKNIIAVEWADKIRSILPKTTITIKFSLIDKNKRKIVFSWRKKD